MKRGGERWREVKRGEARCREVKPGCGHDLPYLYTYPFVGPREWGRDTKSSWVLSRSTGWVQVRCTYREYERLYPYEWDAVWGRGMLSLSRRDVRRWRRAVVERRWRRTVAERRWMRSCGGEAGSEPGCMRTTDEGDQSGLKVHTQTYHAGQRRVAVE